MSKNIREYFRYLPPGPRDRKWGLYVTAAGYQPIAAGEQYPPKGHPASHSFTWHKGRVLDQFGIVYLVRGQGEFESKQTALYDLKEGDAFLLFPGVWHRYKPVQEVGWDVYWAHFQGEEAMRLLENGFISPENPVLKLGLNDIIIDPFVNILDWLRSEPAGFQQMVAASALQIIAAMLSTARSQEQFSHISTLVRHAKAVLEEDVKGMPLMEGIAEELGVSRAYFFRIFNEYTGFTPYQYHLEFKLHRARQMLRNTDLPVNQISRLLGFTSVYHFSRFFKNKTGKSPTAWRKQEIPIFKNEISAIPDVAYVDKD